MPENSRLEAVANLLIKYPDRIPAYVNFPEEYTEMKHKYLIPKDYTVGEFSQYMRNRLKISETKGMLIFINRSLLPVMSDTMAYVYQNNKDPQGMLQISIQIENTFG
tara:strand:- start:570 stop:890 length:321 start_codon:yes stop_codon:yes gene_type:complete